MSYDNSQFIGLRTEHKKLVLKAVNKVQQHKGQRFEAGSGGYEAFAFLDRGEVKWMLNEPKEQRCIARGVWPKEGE